LLSFNFSAFFRIIAKKINKLACVD